MLLLLLLFVVVYRRMRCRLASVWTILSVSYSPCSQDSIRELSRARHYSACASGSTQAFSASCNSAKVCAGLVVWNSCVFASPQELCLANCPQKLWEVRQSDPPHSDRTANIHSLCCTHVILGKTQSAQVSCEPQQMLPLNYNHCFLSGSDRRTGYCQ